MTALSSGRRHALGAVLLGWSLVAFIALLLNWPLITTFHFSDADDALRMVQVRDLLAGQNWFDLHQYRIAPPDGVVMHWSRLVDAPLAAMTLLLRPLLGPARAELMAVVVVPLLTMLAAQLCIARLVARKIDTNLVLTATLMMILTLPTMMQLNPMRIDHHGWQIVAVLAALNALLAKTPRAAAVVAGVSLAFGMSVSLELLPFAGLFGALFALRWWHDPAEWRWLVWYLDVLVLASAVFFASTRGFGDLTNYCDAVSPAYLAGLTIIAAGIHFVALRPAMPRMWLVAGLGFSAVVGAALFLRVAPGCSTGPFARLDPLVRDFWYDNVKEGMPVWRQGLAVFLQMVVPPLAGLGAAIELARREQGRFWREFSFMLGGAILISIAVSRFSSVSSAVAIVPLTWLLRRLAQMFAERRSLLQRILLAGLLVVVLLPSLMLDLAVLGLVWLGATSATPPAAPSLALSRGACSPSASLTGLAHVPRGTILAQLDFGPFILLRTPHRVLATGHHRAASAMHDNISAFLATPTDARAIAVTRHFDYVLICPDMNETRMYAARSPEGLAAQLLAGNSIDWLEPVNLGKDGGNMRLWRVKP